MFTTNTRGEEKKAFYKSKKDFHVFFSLCALLLPFFVSDTHGEKHDTNELDNWENRKLEGGEEKSTWLENNDIKNRKSKNIWLRKFHITLFFCEQFFRLQLKCNPAKKNLRRLISRTYLKNEIIVKALRNKNWIFSKALIYNDVFYLEVDKRGGGS